MNIILIIALLVGGGASLVAEQSLPGDAMYTVKVGVNEEVRDWLTLSNKAQANWEVRKVERRLEEAEELSAEGQLNTETKVKIEERFDRLTEAFAKETAKMEAKEDMNASFEAHSNFEASLKAHERILADIFAQANDSRDEAQSILGKVRAELSAVAEARNDAEIKIEGDMSAEIKTAAMGKANVAENKIEEASEFIVKFKALVDADISSDAEAKLKIAQEAFARGEAEMKAQTYGTAFVSFQESMRIAQEAKLIIASSEKLENNSNVDDDENDDTDSDDENSNDNDSVNLRGNGTVEVNIGL